jgi:integrase
VAGGAGFLAHSNGTPCHFQTLKPKTIQLTQQQEQTYLKAIPSIQAVLLKLEGKGKAPTSLTLTRKHLKALAIRADLNNPEKVEIAIARFTKQNGQPASNNYKDHLCSSYMHYVKYYKLTWERPHYIKQPIAIQPPTNARIETMISAAHTTLSLKLDISYRTGLRPCEIVGNKGLRTRDIHQDQNTITPRSAKGCNARPALKIPASLTTRLQTYITKNQLKPDEILFKGTPERYGEHFIRLKKRMARTLADPQYLNIRLYDIRHAYVTTLLRRIQNAEIVRQIMGHKRLDTTQKYMHLLAGTSGEWIVEGTTDKERAKQLLAQDFTYQLTTPDGTMLFRKPK